MQLILEELREDPQRPERCDERERERNAAEVRSDTRERRQRAANPLGSPLANRCVCDEESRDTSDRRRNQAQLDARPICIDVWVVKERTEVLERVAAGLTLECPDEDGTGR
jgi:hypothetical protein